MRMSNGSSGIRYHVTSSFSWPLPGTVAGLLGRDTGMYCSLGNSSAALYFAGTHGIQQIHTVVLDLEFEPS